MRTSNATLFTTFSLILLPHVYLPLGLRTEAKAVQEKHCLCADGTNIPTVDSRPWQQGKVGTRCDFRVDCYTENMQVNVPGGVWSSSSCPLTSHSLQRLRIVSQARCFWGETRKGIQFLRHWWETLLEVSADFFFP